MLTTHQLVQTSTSYFFPALLLLICWYSAASAIRSFSDLFIRLYYKRGVKRSIQKLDERVERSIRQEKNNPNTTPQALHLQVANLRSQVKELQNELAKNMLLGRKATTGRLFLISAEGILFVSLAIASFVWAMPVVQKIPTHNWWVHVVGVLFFLCFVLKLRRILLLFPLTVMAFLSWEIFSFITTFEKTLEATSLLAKVKVIQMYKPQNEKELPQVKIVLSFRGTKQRHMTLPARQKIYLEGRFYRVSSEVLLFGGKNIATIDRVFSDIMASANGSVLVHKESVPPQYQWQQAQSRLPHLLPRQKMFYWLWKQFFELRKQQSSSERKYIKMVPLASVACTPLIPGKEFEIRLRHVGGLECYVVKKKEPSSPTSQPLIKIKKSE